MSWASGFLSRHAAGRRNQRLYGPQGEALALGDFGKLTVPELLEVPPWVVIAAMAVLTPIALWVIDPIARHSPPGRHLNNPKTTY
jgi:hypothetical protein